MQLHERDVDGGSAWPVVAQDTARVAVFVGVVFPELVWGAANDLAGGEQGNTINCGRRRDEQVLGASCLVLR